MTESNGCQTAIAISQRARRLVRRVLVTSIVLLVILGTLGEIARLAFGYDTLLGFVRLFGLGEEANVPTWFTSATLLVAASLAGTVALLKHDERDAFARHWTALAALLCLMSLDETAMMHELISARAAQLIFNEKGAPWYVLYAWLLPGAILAAFIAWYLAMWWRSLGSQMRPRFTGAAALYFGGALGIEALEAAFVAVFDLAAANSSPLYTALWTTQELLEMTGVAALILALVDYLGQGCASITRHAEPKTVADVRMPTESQPSVEARDYAATR